MEDIRATSQVRRTRKRSKRNAFHNQVLFCRFTKGNKGFADHEEGKKEARSLTIQIAHLRQHRSGRAEGPSTRLYFQQHRVRPQQAAGTQRFMWKLTAGHEWKRSPLTDGVTQAR